MAKKRPSRAPVRERSNYYRFNLVKWGLFFLMVLIVGRLVHIQCLKRDFYLSKAESMRTKKIVVQLRRGTIQDRNQKTLATSVKSTSVFFVPEELEDEEEATALLAHALGVRRDKLLKKARQESGFSWVKRQASNEEREALERLRLRGVGFRNEYRRLYPMGELAAQLVGFVGVDNQGLEGLELQFDGVLGFDPSMQVFDQDGTGRTVGPLRKSLFAMPDLMDVELTLDIKAQHVIQKELSQTVREYGGRCGVGVVMKPATGEILAMATVPCFDPNEFGKFAPERRRNRAVTDLFAPGSTFKPFTAAIAIEAGLVDEETQFNCEKGRYLYHGHWIRDVGCHEWLAFEDVIRKSSNVGMVKLASEIPTGLLYEGVRQFGFGERTGIMLPGEVNGIVHRPRDWSLVSPGQIAIGQEVACTPIQLAAAYASIANGGNYMRPQIVSCLRDKKGRVVKSWKPEESVRSISTETAARITRMLTRVVEDGTGKAAAIPGYRVAGKTGTAQKVDPLTRRYSHEDYTCLFCGFFPAERPELVIVLLVDEPRKEHLAGKVVAPVFSRIGQQLAVLYAIEPGREEEENKDKQPASPSSAPHDPLRGMQVKESFDTQGTMPNVLGLTMTEVLKRLGEAPLGEVRFRGSGIAVAQCPVAGVPLEGKPPCAVAFSR